MAIAAGPAIQMFILNLSLSSQSCVFVAAIVVSEIKLRLSPKYAPPTTVATSNGILCPVCSAIFVAMGVSAAMVPTLVPTDREIKQAAAKRPPKISFDGSMLSVSSIVASIAPISFAVDANAPAKINIQIIRRMLGCAAPRVKSSNRFPHRILGMMHIAYRQATINEMVMGTA